jgi:predicted O-methyltransferase YrrM
MDKSAFKIDGYLHEPECELLANEAGKVNNGIIVELGSFLGKSTAILASNIKENTKVYAIDLWKDENIYQGFVKNINKWNNLIEIKRIDSHGKEIPNIYDIDLLFIDADHSYESCFSDLNIWYDRVKDGGIILIHDYTEPGCGVGKAVSNFFRLRQVKNKMIISSILRIKK